MSMAQQDIEAEARTILSSLDGVHQIPRFSDRVPPPDLDEAYAIAAAVVAQRVARGERPVGWKVGFTNRTIWDEYDVHAPIWGPIYDSTIEPALNGLATCSAALFCEPRIEPEIALRLVRIPDPEMDDRALLGCIDAIAHGFEIVQSLFAEWRFAASDTVAGCALHGCYRHGPFVPVDAAQADEWCEKLSRFRITLSCDDVAIDEGGAENILGGPLQVLRHLARGLADNPHGWALRPGDIVSTGTVTRAFPVTAGQRWESRITGLPLTGLTLEIR
ncbi:MAG: fumarylacetoacetate hydrolase family protein [Salinarimonas sp.]|nr:fumarylacetoacetate hydrolase family protein [Salinarimonas sp.]